MENKQIENKKATITTTVGADATKAVEQTKAQGGRYKDALKLVASVASDVCEEIFGSDCSFDSYELASSIINNHPVGISHGATESQTHGTWGQAIKAIKEAPTSLRQHAIIRVAGSVHDLQVKDEEFIHIEKFHTYTHWWLMGVEEVRCIASQAEVDAVLRYLQLIREDDIQKIACPHNPQVVRTTDMILGKSFERTYQEISWERQKAEGVTVENLPEKIDQGRNFYPFMPEILCQAIKDAPPLPLVIASRIEEKVDLLYDETEVIIKAKKGKKIKGSKRKPTKR